MFFILTSHLFQRHSVTYVQCLVSFFFVCSVLRLLSFARTKHWYLNGKRHREDGPACEYVSGRKEWHLNGKPISEADHRLRDDVTF